MNKFTLALDSAQLGTFKTCPQSFKFMFKQNLRLYGLSRPAADKGTIVHSMLDVYYTLNALNSKVDKLKHINTTVKLVKDNKLVQAYGFDGETEQFIAKRFIQYGFKYYGKDFAPIVKNNKVSVEIGFSVPIYEDKENLFILEGRIDLLTRHPDFGLMFIDNKTQDRISFLYPYKLQFMCYALATRAKYGIINYFGLQQKYDEK